MDPAVQPVDEEYQTLVRDLSTYYTRHRANHEARVRLSYYNLFVHDPELWFHDWIYGTAPFRVSQLEHALRHQGMHDWWNSTLARATGIGVDRLQALKRGDADPELDEALCIALALGCMDLDEPWRPSTYWRAPEWGGNRISARTGFRSFRMKTNLAQALADQPVEPALRIDPAEGPRHPESHAADLAVAVLAQAVRDAADMRQAHRAHQVDAAAWLASDSVSECSCAWWCALLGLELDWVRRMVRKVELVADDPEVRFLKVTPSQETKDKRAATMRRYWERRAAETGQSVALRRELNEAVKFLRSRLRRPDRFSRWAAQPVQELAPLSAPGGVRVRPMTAAERRAAFERVLADEQDESP